MNRIKTMGNNKGGFSARMGGWSSYSKPVRLDKKGDDVDISINKQIKKDSKEVNSHLGKESTTIDTTDKETREANKDMLPMEG
tara:strand:+ start:39 stop:287 length:249 start_codon:yes stop_codon:yes gene_type:complete